MKRKLIGQKFQIFAKRKISSFEFAQNGIGFAIRLVTKWHFLFLMKSSNSHSPPTIISIPTATKTIRCCHPPTHPVVRAQDIHQPTRPEQTIGIKLIEHIHYINVNSMEYVYHICTSSHDTIIYQSVYITHNTQ